MCQPISDKKGKYRTVSITVSLFCSLYSTDIYVICKTSFCPYIFRKPDLRALNRKLIVNISWCVIIRTFASLYLRAVMKTSNVQIHWISGFSSCLVISLTFWFSRYKVLQDKEVGHNLFSFPVDTQCGYFWIAVLKPLVKWYVLLPTGVVFAAKADRGPEWGCKAERASEEDRADEGWDQSPGLTDQWNRGTAGHTRLVHYMLWKWVTCFYSI